MERASSWARDGVSERILVASFFMGAPRCTGERALHEGKAAWAAETAESTSAADASGTEEVC